MDSVTVPQTSYTGWLRGTIARVRQDRNLLVSLFDSSVPEPVEELRALIHEGFAAPTTSRYTSAFAGGNPYVMKQLTRAYGVGPEAVLTTTGATGALALIYRALTRPGDRILVESPGFDLFETLARAHGLEVDRFIRHGDGFAIDPAEVAAGIGPRTRLVVLSNLHNPSGMALGEGTLRELAALAAARGVAVVVDEVYRDYAAPERMPPAAATLTPSLISVSSLTKSHGLSTLRCGWIVAAPEWMEPIRRFADEVEFGVSNLAHAVAALVLEREAQFAERRRQILTRARPIIESYHAWWRAEGLVAGDLPQDGCITFPRLVGMADTRDFCEWLARRCGVIVAPGAYFGAAGHVRLGFARAPSDIDYGLQALTDGLISYRENR